MSDEPGALAWIGVLLVTLCGLFAALLEVLLVPLYSGATIVPVTVVLGVVGNLALPRLARALVPRTGAAALPFVAWLVVVIGFGTVTRPEGDVILPGAPDSSKYVTYALLLLGALAGAIAVAWWPGRPATPGAAPRGRARPGPRPDRAEQGHRPPHPHRPHQGRRGSQPGGGSAR